MKVGKEGKKKAAGNGIEKNMKQRRTWTGGPPSGGHVTGVAGNTTVPQRAYGLSLRQGEVSTLGVLALQVHLPSILDSSRPVALQCGSLPWVLPRAPTSVQPWNFSLSSQAAQIQCRSSLGPSSEVFNTRHSAQFAKAYRN